MNEKLTVRVGRYSVELSNLDKILFPKSNITKGDLIKYYASIADIMLPFIKNRPLTMYRFPNGINEEGFYQKDAAEYFPDWIERIPVEKKGDGVVNYVNCTTKAALVYLANQACITPHIWLSKLPDLNKPDRMIFDLDPAGKATFALVRNAALDFKGLLEDQGLTSFVMTTGSRGLHVVVPLKPEYYFNEVRSYARLLAQILVQENPKNYTLEMRKAKRENRIFIDFLRNSWSATAVAPFAVRTKEHAPVATPLYWDEVHDARLSPQKYRIGNVFDYLKTHGNPWQDIERHKNKIKPS